MDKIKWKFYFWVDVDRRTTHIQTTKYQQQLSATQYFMGIPGEKVLWSCIVDYHIKFKKKKNYSCCIHHHCKDVNPIWLIEKLIILFQV